ncbi:unnamed protein product [Gongylonema pulchrum]|uniref:Transmembrane protein n=1 Tax=Gongylonema pulchrum TaxID=637853 RepID=A0A183DV41_9BILA|nr:unnamed protein product [Gongylonema pulchrum]
MFDFACTAIRFSVVIVRRSQKFSESFRKKEPNRKLSSARMPLWKLAVNGITFAVFNSFYACFALFMLGQHKCYFQLHFGRMMRVIGLTRLALLMRILLDVLISFTIDYQIRLELLGYFGLEGIEPSETQSSQRVGPAERTQSEELTSDPVTRRSGQWRSASCMAHISTQTDKDKKKNNNSSSNNNTSNDG